MFGFNGFKMRGIKFLLIFISLVVVTFQIMIAQEPERIPADRILVEQELLDYLKRDIPELSDVYTAIEKNDRQRALHLLAAYFRVKAATRYYFNWKHFPIRFKNYQQMFPAMKNEHLKLSEEQMATYAPETNWQLPFKNLLGQDVTAYELRHLARQQKSFNMVMMYYYSGENTKYLDYFVRQVADLNRAFLQNKYDDAGNGIYELFRAGKRIHNWLFCYNAYLASPNFDEQKQLLLVRTFLHHGAQLKKRTQKISYGNHNTKGLAALFEIASQFPEFIGTDQWIKQALAGVEWHLKNEVNPDGFQFERSVHYHKTDIENYLRVYNLSRRNNLPLSEIFVIQFRRMFDVLVKIAQPDRLLPVLQDDTDSPFMENNTMDDVMMVGTIIFQDGTFRYFTNHKISADYYWFFNEHELNISGDIRPEIPDLGSVSLPATGYYVMRNGWNENDCYMIISAGLSKRKPDHQQGEMLGIVAYAKGNEILPNYQVKYNLPDYPFWKNSWVKNVTLADGIPLGRGWTPNEGGSGFGKWAHLPQPRIISWVTDLHFDYFCGSHDSYDSLGIKYYREVLFIKDGFWIVRDHFSSKSPRIYQQIWQGIYDIYNNHFIHKSCGSESILDISQLTTNSLSIHQKIFRDKGCTYFQTDPKTFFIFTTLVNPRKLNIRPFSQTMGYTELKGGWKMTVVEPQNESQTDKEKMELRTDAKIRLVSNSGRILLLDMTFLQFNGLTLNLRDRASLMISKTDQSLELWYLGVEENNMQSEGVKDMPGTIKAEIISPGQYILVKVK